MITEATMLTLATIRLFLNASRPFSPARAAKWSSVGCAGHQVGGEVRNSSEDLNASARSGKERVRRCAMVDLPVAMIPLSLPLWPGVTPAPSGFTDTTDQNK